MLGFRLDEGLSFSVFYDKFGIDFKGKYRNQIDKLKGEGLLIEKEDKVLATYEGSLLLHRIIEEFM
jgi:coproporphyrinogen III oxidase-like Fe-S oxidoreductase